MVVIVFGLPGSGKSYFASRLAVVIDAEYIKSNSVRTIFSGKRTYSINEKMLVYNEMAERMKVMVKKNRNVVLDATFYTNDIRTKFIDEAKGKGTIFFIEVIADEAVIKERVNKKRMDSNADFEVYKKLKNEWEPLHEEHLILQSNDDNIEEMLNKAVNYLSISNDKRFNK